MDVLWSQTDLPYLGLVSNGSIIVVLKRSKLLLTNLRSNNILASLTFFRYTYRATPNGPLTVLLKKGHSLGCITAWQNAQPQAQLTNAWEQIRRRANRKNGCCALVMYCHY